jgi:hypothetical protein
MQTTTKAILGTLVLAAIGGLVYYFATRKKKFGTLQLRSSDWTNKKFTFETPFGPKVITAASITQPGDNIVIENEDYQIVARSSEKYLAVAMAHLNPADPTKVKEYILDYDTKTAFPSTVLVEQYKALYGL